jgi:23S rRNA pseudouridine2605 synthase
VPHPDEGRIAKVLARRGIASRRDVEEMITQGRITLNGEVVETPGVRITQQDVVTLDGQVIGASEPTRLWLHHKTAGTVTTNYDPEGRPTVFDQLPEDLPRVVTVGRLDINTTGLLLLTNDGHLARVLEHPKTQWPRCYRVRAYGHVTQDILDGLKNGVTVEGIEYGPIEASLDREVGDNIWLTMTLYEGKNREIKVVLGSLGLTVNRLIRTSFGPFSLGDLKENELVEIPDCLAVTQVAHALKQHGDSNEGEADAQEGGTSEEDLSPDNGERRSPQQNRFSHGDKPLKRKSPSLPSREREFLGPQRYIWRAEDENKGDSFRNADGKSFFKKKKALGKKPPESHKRLGRIKTRKGDTVLVEKTIRSIET